MLKEMCVSGERGRGAAFGGFVDVEGVFDVEGFGLGVAVDGGGGRDDIVMVVCDFLFLRSLLLGSLVLAGWRFFS